MTLRSVQLEWNALVPQAQARGLRGVREVRIGQLREPIARRLDRLEWLRRELNITTSLSTPVAPTAAQSPGFTFGVELELIMPAGMTREQLATRVRDAGVPCIAEFYNHSVRTNWKIVTDGSLGDMIHGAEVVSPILSGDDGFAQLRKVCDALTAAGCRVSKSCGLHVHVGARSENLQFFRTLVKMYAAAEQAIDSFLAPSRRGSANTYCMPVRLQGDVANARTIEGIANCIGQTSQNGTSRRGRRTGIVGRGTGRYCKLNLQSYWQHGTVEFRQHQGTVDAAKTENWVRFCLRMAVAARAGAAPATTLEALLSTIGATESEAAYITARARMFNRVLGRVA